MRTVINSVKTESFDAFEKFAMSNQDMMAIKGGTGPLHDMGQEEILTDPEKEKK